METATQKFELIELTLTHSHYRLKVSYLCQLAGVSRSGYYYWHEHTRINQEKREIQDLKDRDLILEAYHFKGFKKGRKGIRNRLLHMGILMNEKKIRRLMIKFHIVCPKRRKKFQNKQEGEPLKKPHILQRNFKAYGPRTVLLTDITYLPYGRDKFAYLSTIKDAYTNEILAYVVKEHMRTELVIETFDQLYQNHSDSLTPATLIHSDQGSQYTSLEFDQWVQTKEWMHSMSRKGNCWDNAPQESFFGHMKDHVRTKECEDFEEVVHEINRYMNYYNEFGYQTGLYHLSPKEFYQFYLTDDYPLDNLLPKPKLPKIKTIEYLMETEEI